MLATAPQAWASSGDLATYVKARAADADGDVARAAAGYANALNDAPDNVVIAIRAYREAMTAGDMELARSANAVLERNQVASPDSYLFTIADAAERHDWKRASGAIDRIEDGPLGFLAPSIRAWIAVSSHKGDPLQLLGDAKDSAIGQRYAAQQRALLLIARGKAEQGLPILQTTLDPEGSDTVARLAAARLLVRKHDANKADVLLRGTGFAGAKLGGAKADAEFGIATLYASVLAGLNSDRVLPLQILLGRSALMLQPDDDHVRLLLADALSRDGSEGEAANLLAQVDGNGPFGTAARQERLTMLSRAGRTDEALTLARTIAEEPGADLQNVRDYGDLLAADGQYATAADVYGRALDMAGSQASWALYLQRGGALEQAGHWDEALPLLQKAEELAPDEPIVLNYLGYAQVERGDNLADAQALIEKAKRLRPDDASITDSLGWAYYQRGKVDKAVPLLESAAQQRPADVTVNEHLGDAYWRAGRRYEARYAWRAAAITADGKDAERLAAKVSHGLVAQTN